MNEISSEEIYEGLLAYGLFAEQMPAIFTGKHFFEFCKSSNPSFPKVPAEYVYYENMRNINVPRAFGIPNPAAYQRLCKCIADNWGNLQQYFKGVTENQNHIISRIHLRKLKDKPQLFEMNYNNWRIDGTPESDLLINAKYLVKADVSNCFPSIYTHVLSWALVGKETAKLNQNDYTKWYNKLDFYVRNINNGQTHGLIIGPHTSNLLSEIILTKIDQMLFDDGWKFIRKIDDYSCYVESHERGQAFLVSLNKCLRYYGLLLNHKKTSVKELPSATVEQWVRRINAFTAFDMKNSMNYKEVQAYFDLSIELMKENEGNSAVLKYAIKVLSNKKLSANAKEYCTKTIMHLTLIYPYLATLLDKYVFDAFAVDSSLIGSFSQNLLDSGIKSRNYEEASLAVYFALKYGAILDGIDFCIIEDSNHCVFMLLCYLYHKQHKNSEQLKLLRELAETLKQTNMDAYWLFVYEVLPQSKLNDYWKNMKKQGVSFLKLSEEV
jgi:hypothetical protein